MKSCFKDLQRFLHANSMDYLTFNGELFRFPLHHHEEYELVVVEEGSGQWIIGDNLQTFSAGDVMLIGRMMPHAWHRATSNTKVHIIHFTAGLIESICCIPEFKHVKVFFEKLRSYVLFSSTITILERMYTFENSGEEQRVIAFMPLIIELSSMDCIFYIDEIVPNIKRNTDCRIDDICKYVHKHFRQPITLTEMSEKLCLSESSFCKCFKRTTGMTFISYLNLVRIHAVCRELEVTEKTISQIAFEHGFDNVPYFNRVFKNEVKLSPKHYRLQKKNATNL